MSGEEQVTDEELRRRVVHVMLRPAARLGRAFGISLKELRAGLDMAYYYELVDMGLTQREVADRLGVSERTAGKLARQLRERFLQPELQHNLPRRIEFMLGTTPMGEGRLCQVMPETDPEHVKAAIAELLAQRRIREIPGRRPKYEPSSPVRRLPRDTWMDRVGALASFSENLTNAVFGRFFRTERRAFARTVTFRGRPEVFERLAALYEERVLPELEAISLEGDAAEHSDSEAVQMSICWAPYEYMDAQQTEET